MHLFPPEDINMENLEEWTPEDHEWTPEATERTQEINNDAEYLKQLKSEHPYLIGLSEALQKHPAINKAINKTAPYAEHLNRIVQGTGLPNLSKGFFTGSDKLLRGLASMTPTGVGLPNVDIPDPGFSEAVIPDINPAVQGGAEAIGQAIPYLAGLGSNVTRAQQLGEKLSDLPLTKKMASRALREALQTAKGREIGELNIPTNLIEDLKQFLPETTPYKKLLQNAMNKDYESLFNLQSDVGSHSSDFAKALFSAAERSHGREGLAARNRLIDAMRSSLNEAGHGDISELMKHGQNRYRQYMNLRPWRNAAALTAISSAVPYYSKLKSLIP
jgi:hypothetical protein